MKVVLTVWMYSTDEEIRILVEISLWKRPLTRPRRRLRRQYLVRYVRETDCEYVHSKSCPSVRRVEPSGSLSRLITRFNAFTAVMFQVEVFSVMKPCSFVVGYQRFRASCCLHLQGDVAGIGKNGMNHYTASQPRRPRLETVNGLVW
jgi:hypothetical protein